MFFIKAAAGQLDSVAQWQIRLQCFGQWYNEPSKCSHTSTCPCRSETGTDLSRSCWVSSCPGIWVKTWCLVCSTSWSESDQNSDALMCAILQAHTDSQMTFTLLFYALTGINLWKKIHSSVNKIAQSNLCLFSSLDWNNKPNKQEKWKKKVVWNILSPKRMSRISCKYAHFCNQRHKVHGFTLVWQVFPVTALRPLLRVETGKTGPVQLSSALDRKKTEDALEGKLRSFLSPVFPLPGASATHY